MFFNVKLIPVRNNGFWKECDKKRVAKYKRKMFLLCSEKEQKIEMS